MFRGTRKIRSVALLTCVFLSCYFFWSISRSQPTIFSSHSIKKLNISRDITIVIRQFDQYSHNLAETVGIWSSVLGGAPVIIFTDRLFNSPNSIHVGSLDVSIRQVSLELSLDASRKELDALSHVETEYILLVPDFSKPPSRKVMETVAADALKLHKRRAIVIPGSYGHGFCQKINWDYSGWTLSYKKVKVMRPSTPLCDGVRHQHALLIQTELLRDLPVPFIQPSPEALYLQTSARKIQLHVHKDAQITTGVEPTDALVRARSAKTLRERRSALYSQLGVKKVVAEDGHVTLYGCTRETERCFPASHPPTPAYVVSGRDTPPCCLRHLQSTLRRVLRALSEEGARCWLEQATLLGAHTRGALLPWLDRAEVGVYSADVPGVSWLGLARAKGEVTDTEGYVWERHPSGRYYRVAFSTFNRIYVDILPFKPHNGTMKRDGWLLGHQKDFPEHYLHPMTTIKLSNLVCPSPNNVPEFLQFKFDKNILDSYDKIGYRILYPEM